MQQEEIPSIIIIGGGLGGLTLYHALIKNKDKKEFNVKIFERESSPQDRWQGFHIGLASFGIQSLLKCIPPSTASNLQKAMPDPIPDVEYHSISITDHTGKQLFKPNIKQVKNVYEIANTPDSFILTYRDILRNVLLENVPVQWNKKCTGYEETEDGVLVYFEDGSQEFCNILVGADGVNSPIRKQKVPELQLFDYGITFINADVPVPKSIMDILLKIHDKCCFQKTLGLNGDVTAVAFRIIPIENYKDKDEPHYRTTIGYAYPTSLDDDSDKKVDDNDPATVVEHVKLMIRKLRPNCEYTDIMLQLWELVPKTTPNEQDDYPFKTYNTIQRRKMQDINPLSVNSWKTSRVTLIGDAAHAMSPVMGLGANNAIQDADNLSQALLNYSPDNSISCIKEYENKMLKRRSADVLKSRSAALSQSSPIGYFGVIIRNTILKIMHITWNVYFFVNNLISRK
ncbi:hypothetical protein C1645_805098 [Glomus cerebriforme]|uniref:FAD-binding domain-containing protein n=1 Tax=Glomus cerebriforme TaxID=658196 RepID=A0A397T0E5_9GLOM|nr:hypothetical protein C1645_805098 [Glomus cerebriforme]